MARAGVGSREHRGGAPAKARRRRIRVLAALASLALLLLPAAAAARPAALDKSFGNHGRAFGFTGLPVQWERVPALAATAPDGDVYLATQVEGSEYHPMSGPDFHVQLRRLLPNGRLDPGFGNSGIVECEIGAEHSFSLAGLVVDSAGRPLLLGTSYGPRTSFMGPYPLGPIYPSYATAVRYTSDGNLDSSFGNRGGIAEFGFDLPLQPPYEKPAVKVIEAGIDGRGRIDLVVAQQVSGARSSFVEVPKLVARLTPSGALDPSFGGGGTVPLSGIAVVDDMAVGRRGEIALAMLPDSRAEGNSATLIRLDPSGSPDGSFGPAGARTYAKLGSIVDLAIDRAQRIVAMRQSLNGKTVLARIRPNGRLDASFGKRGRVWIALPRPSYLNAIGVDARNRVFAVGGYFARRQPQVARREFVVLRRLASGKADRRFGDDGMVTTRFGRQADAAASEAMLDGRGHLLVAGLAHLPASGQLNTQAVARYSLAR